MKFQRSLAAVTLGLFILATPLTGCGMIKKLTGGDSKEKQQAQKTGQKQEKPKIGVILSPQKEENPQIKQGLIDAAKKENVQLVFIQDPKKELDQKGKDLKALIIQGGDEDTTQTAKLVGKQKYPIVAIDQVEGVKADALVAPNYNQIGQLQADYIKNKVKSGNLVILQAPDPGAGEIVSALKASLAQSSDLKIAQTFTSPSQGVSPVANLNDYLTKNPGNVQAVVATDSKLALEAIESLKKNNLDKKLVVVGAGTHKQAIEKVVSGDLNADVDKSPYLQGMYSFKLASQLVKQQTADADSTVTTDTGETPAKLVPVRLVVPENVAQFQKTYNQPAPQEEEEKQGEQGKQEGKSEQSKQTQANNQSQGSDNKQGSAKSEGQSSNQQSQNKPLPSGVTQVREKVRTETTREMLGQDGKVMGTEHQVTEEVRTLPAALVQAQEQAGQAGKESGDKKEQKKDQSDSKEQSNSKSQEE